MRGTVHELRDAESVSPNWADRIGDYNRQAPHSALGMRRPAEYRGEPRTHAPICLAN
jgi:hypothetical protein